MHHCNTPFERFTMDITGPFLESDRGNQYFLITMNFTKWPEPYNISNQEAPTVADFSDQLLLLLWSPKRAAQ
jgi:hypothetical protein